MEELGRGKGEVVVEVEVAVVEATKRAEAAMKEGTTRYSCLVSMNLSNGWFFFRSSKEGHKSCKFKVIKERRRQGQNRILIRKRGGGGN